MTLEAIINILLGILAIIVSFISWYFYVKSKIYKATEGAVNDAEQDGKTAEEKLSMAVEQVYSVIPAILKPIISKEVVRGIVQAAFDKIEAYAKKQVAKKGKKDDT